MTQLDTPLTALPADLRRCPADDVPPRDTDAEQADAWAQLLSNSTED